jgi:alanine dehydrogenase
MSECIDTIEAAFRQQGAGKAIESAVLGAHVEGGGFHIKTAGLRGDSGEPAVFATKVNANFPGNQARNGLPTIQGVVLLFDAEVGAPLAILDSIELTSVRTAAATAVAARYLAREHASTVTICGCGEQGRSQLRALRCVRPIDRVFALDVELAKAEQYAIEMREELDIEVVVVRELGAITRQVDIWVTCTPAQHWFVGRDHVAPGTFIAAVGADNPKKQEIAPDLLAANTVVADVLDQCVVMGDLHHAIALGQMTREDVHAELTDIVVGRRPGRRTDDEIIVFDSTGTALEDVAAAKLVYDRAVATGLGLEIDLGSATGAPNVKQAICQ